MTDYVVFKQQTVDEGEAFHIVAYEKARSSRAAIQAVLDSKPQSGQYAAVPSRSFRPVTVTVETKTALKFS